MITFFEAALYLAMAIGILAVTVKFIIPGFREWMEERRRLEVARRQEEARWINDKLKRSRSRIRPLNR